MNNKKFEVIRKVVSRLAIFAAIISVFVFLAASPTIENKALNNTSCAKTFPAKGNYSAAFYDMINGGTCWSCPKGYVRSAASVKASNACVAMKKATKVGRYGCKKKYGSGAFLDPRNGGECWTCPSGYKRTLEAVTSSKACAKGVFGPFSKATRKGKSGCDKGFGDPIDGGTCWSCPKNSVRTVFSVKSNKACEVRSKGVFRGKNLTKKRLSAKGKQKSKQVATSFAKNNDKVIKVLNNAFKKLNNERKSAFANKALENAVKSGNYQPIWNKIKGDLEPALKQIRQLQKTPQYKSIADFTVVSIGVSGEGTAFAGGGVEQGLLIYFADPNNIKLRGYTEYGAVLSTSVGVGVGVSVGIWRAAEVDCGAGFDISVSVGLSFAEIGGTIAINPNFPCKGNWEDLITLNAIDGFAIGLSVGAGVPLSPVNMSAAFSSQVIWDGKARKYCNPCGGRGQEPCGLTESFPSCKVGLIEDCGVCR